MRHFRSLTDADTARLFHAAPEQVLRTSPASLLAVALGATLYCPGTRPDLAGDVRKQVQRGCASVVFCLEDSIADADVPTAEANVVAALRTLAAEAGATASASASADSGAPDTVDDGLPLLFVRVRTPEQLLDVARRLGDAIGVLSGFVLPKFEETSGAAFLDALAEARSALPADVAQRIRVMPIIESPVVLHRETRTDALDAIRALLTRHRDDVLAVRIGATDLSSVFGLRRSRDLTIYDVQVISSVIADVVNLLARREDGFVVTGPVWEHFSDTERLLRPQLRLTPFAEAQEEDLRRELLLRNFDGLMREVALDQANGLLGKTVIHPSHVAVVHAMSVVSHEEHLDALAIAGRVEGGVSASPYRNKMNEMKPHQGWAERTLLRGRAFGVAAPDVTYVDLLEASMA